MGSVVLGIPNFSSLLMIVNDIIERVDEVFIGVLFFMFLENYALRHGFLKGYFIALSGNLDKLRPSNTRGNTTMATVKLYVVY
jgi:hypothetical protein